MAKSKNLHQHCKDLQELVYFYKQAYSRHKQSHQQISMVAATSQEPQEKVSHIVNIVHIAEVMDATETGRCLFYRRGLISRPEPNIDVLLFFDGIWRVGRYLTTEEHFLQYGQEYFKNPRFYCHSDGLERLLIDVQEWRFIH